MAFRGERFVLDLDDDTPTIPIDPIPSPFSLIGEIREREPTSATPPAPAPPTSTSASSTGFPAHRRRDKPSSFKQRRAEQQAAREAPAPPTTLPAAQDDKGAIGEENRRHLASMSEAQIQREREELMASMDPGLLERFLRRARIDEDEKASTEPAEAPLTLAAEESAAAKPRKSVSFDIPAPASDAKPAPSSAQKHSITPQPPGHDDRPPAHLPKDLHPASETPIMDPSVIETFHFPRPTQPMPTLDPSSPSFLTDLQSHYFPELSTDSSSLSWLHPPSSDAEDPDSTSAYHPSSSAISVAPSAIRFSLRGEILAPSTSLQLPTSLGLHHHGDDPLAAGYTIPELAILSRSTFAVQRCVAWQVLGRILFRLGRAEFGDRGGQLSEGLWYVIEKEGIVGGMLAEAEGASGQSPRRARASAEDKGEKEEKNEKERPTMPVASGIGRHASAAAWAMEGVWLWQKGGGGDRGFLKEGQIRSQ
ncbi:uncharacterized protein N7482_009382 [Penicillium canariense]|uniref:Transcription factor Rba50 n=1 Tax=Penicillium canariense TaxID=189055 RepID=A0A9W9LFN8_9EURO|nr:uncharacterized protein N7482_009382 [Penicillium canariense]KAJ5152904.1 hypothetical protein N7482_009382 [Penicillium canariense]